MLGELRMNITSSLKAKLHKSLIKFPHVMQIIQEINAAGGRALLVGGAVRDLLLGLSPKDIDIEVHGLKIDQFQKILEKFGRVSLVGKSFGVLRLNGLDVDWSVPRKDSKGRKPKVVIDSNMSLEEAFRRRDLTVNAMGIDLITHELIDPFGGMSDLKAKQLRVTDKKLFVEDPLRFFRVMQFIGRFEMEPDAELNKICKKMDLSKISRERIEEEFNKLFLRSRSPSLGIEWLRKVGRLKEILPEVNALVGIEQDKKWHPEGDVYIHTLQVLDAMAALAHQKKFNKHDTLMLMWAALCHDLGKPETSEEWEDGGVSSYEHEAVGVPLAKKLMKRFSRDKDLIDGVAKVVKYHMQPGQFIKNKAKPAAYKRLALKLAPHVTLETLALFACADKLGRNPSGMSYSLQSSIGKKLCNDEFVFRDNAKKLKVLNEVEVPVLHGRDLMGSVAPGPKMGRLLKKAYEIQIEEGIKNKAKLK